MREGRNTTEEERIQIAKDCIATSKNYGEIALKYTVKKIGRGGEERFLSQIRQAHIYTAIKECGYPVEACCKLLGVARSAYHKWASGKCSPRDEKWLTDVTEFKWYEGTMVHKVYLSAILDLYDRRIVAFELGERNDNPLVFKTFDKAVKATSNATPLFHSDRGFQYTNRTFYRKLMKAGMTQSMSRVGKCIDNGPMEKHNSPIAA